MRKSEIHGIRLKRAYDEPEVDDGYRVLVDALWPRGLSKADLLVDEWNKSIAPSRKLRQWFGHDRTRWDGFVNNYRRELEARPDIVEALLSKCHECPVTLVYAASDRSCNNAVALKHHLEALAARVG